MDCNGTLCQSMPQQRRKYKKKNKPHWGKNNDEDDESESEEIRQITQINQIIPDKNDRYEIKIKINGKNQNLTNDSGSQVTIMPNTPELYNQKAIQPLKENYQDVNKNEINFLGKIWVDIEYNGETTKLPHTKTRQYTTARRKLAKTTANYHQQNIQHQNWTNTPTNQTTFAQKSANGLK